jgi:hypothetical protein
LDKIVARESTTRANEFQATVDCSQGPVIRVDQCVRCRDAGYVDGILKSELPGGV